MASIVRVITEDIYQKILRLGLLEENEQQNNAVEMNQDYDKDLLEKVPAEFRQNVKNTLEILKKHGFSWNHQGEYTFAGEFEPDSDISNLVLSLSTPKPNPSVQEAKFLEILSKLGLFETSSTLNNPDPIDCPGDAYPWKTFEDLTTFKNGAWTNKSKSRRFDSVYVYNN